VSVSMSVSWNAGFRAQSCVVVSHPTGRYPARCPCSLKGAAAANNSLRDPWALTDHKSARCDVTAGTLMVS